MPLGAPNATVRIDVPGNGGQIFFDPPFAPQVFLVLDTGVGGRSSGTLDVGGLLVLGTGGSATLFGTVDGFGGFGAAAVSQISPRVDAAYTFNGCVIATATCLTMQNLLQAQTAAYRAVARSRCWCRCRCSRCRNSPHRSDGSPATTWSRRIFRRWITDMRHGLLALLMLLAASCAKPPAASYVGASAGDEGLDLGANASDEPCRQQAARADLVDIYCADWDQPAGSARRGAAAGPADLAWLATSSEWRLGLNLRFVCEPPAPVALADAQSALLLRCTRRVGGWPQVALIASVDGKAYFADGILPLLPVLERSVAVLSGHLAPAAAASSRPSPAMHELIDRLAARAFTIGDVKEYYRLMALGARANLSEDFISAATAYRAALKLQQTALGRDNPNTSVPLMSLALQLSNQGSTARPTPHFAPPPAWCRAPPTSRRRRG